VPFDPWTVRAIVGRKPRGDVDLSGPMTTPNTTRTGRRRGPERRTPGFHAPGAHGPGPRARARGASAVLLLASALGVTAALGCAKPPPPRVEAIRLPYPEPVRPPRTCARIVASPNLNLYEGEPHVVVLYFYPLQSETAFQESDLRDLIAGEKPAGLTGERWEATVLPGETLLLDEPLPRDTSQLGIVADYYRGPSRVVLSGRCASERLVLSATGLQVGR
jgi:type VI secretion system VasD/TssJ family lipoprotein